MIAILQKKPRRVRQKTNKNKTELPVKELIMVKVRFIFFLLVFVQFSHAMKKESPKKKSAKISFPIFYPEEIDVANDLHETIVRVVGTKVTKKKTFTFCTDFQRYAYHKPTQGSPLVMLLNKGEQSGDEVCAQAALKNGMNGLYVTPIDSSEIEAIQKNLGAEKAFDKAQAGGYIHDIYQFLQDNTSHQRTPNKRITPKKTTFYNHAVKKHTTVVLPQKPNGIYSYVALKAALTLRDRYNEILRDIIKKAHGYESAMCSSIDPEDVLLCLKNKYEMHKAQKIIARGNIREFLEKEHAKELDFYPSRWSNTGHTDRGLALKREGPSMLRLYTPWGRLDFSRSHLSGCMFNAERHFTEKAILFVDTLGLPALSAITEEPFGNVEFEGITSVRLGLETRYQKEKPLFAELGHHEICGNLKENFEEETTEEKEEQLS